VSAPLCDHLSNRIFLFYQLAEYRYADHDGPRPVGYIFRGELLRHITFRAHFRESNKKKETGLAQLGIGVKTFQESFLIEKTICARLGIHLHQLGCVSFQIA